ncbi:MAG: DNA polymerase III subunit alpha [Deltaproteobacteria bacterium]
MESNQADFVHLHVHTDYSFLDSTIRIDALLEKAKDFGMSAVAMTDTDNLSGAIEFYIKARTAGIKPIIGCEFGVTPDSQKEELPRRANDLRHLVVLAENNTGYHNLIKLTSAAYLESAYKFPCVDKVLLQKHREGLIGMSACLEGEIACHLKEGRKDAAVEAARSYLAIFGNGNFFLEITDNGLPIQEKVNAGIMEISKQLSIPVVAANDCHYLTRNDYEAHDILRCIRTGKTLKDINQTKFVTNQFYFRSADEMKQLFHYCPEAIKNSGIIAERCNIDLDFREFHLPQIENYPGENLDERLKIEATEGLVKRMPHILRYGGAVNQELYSKRLHEELDIIKSKGFSGYFLIVSDFVRYAKNNSIAVGPGRATAASSLVAYATEITNIDPVRYGLIFERFLNHSRVSMPDIDIDFCQEKRDDIIKYVAEKYGKEKVARIIDFDRMSARRAIKDVGRVLDISNKDVNSIAKMMPPHIGYIPNVIDDVVKMKPQLQEKERNSESIKKLLRLSRCVEGLKSYSSIDESGVVISDVPLVEDVPLCKSQRDGAIVTQFSMNDLYNFGLTKFDFFGLKTLTIIKNILAFIKQNRGEKIDIDIIPLNDSMTYELLTLGDTKGVFQLEGAGMRKILTAMKPDRFEDIIALIAMYRPVIKNTIPDFIGRKLGITKITYEVPELEDILKETYGAIIYQEQVMQIASLIGNYTMTEADTLRRVMSKKKTVEMEQEKRKFLAGAKVKKISEQKANKIWEQMETFSEYGFNKSHSTAYAMISYQTAYLKAHYPREFMAAERS